jgi:hypothetical protein
MLFLHLHFLYSNTQRSTIGSSRYISGHFPSVQLLQLRLEKRDQIRPIPKGTPLAIICTLHLAPPLSLAEVWLFPPQPHRKQMPTIRTFVFVHVKEAVNLEEQHELPHINAQASMTQQCC